MPAEGCQDHAVFIEDCMGCEGGKWEIADPPALLEVGWRTLRR